MNWRKSIVVLMALVLFAVPLFKSSAQVSSSGSTPSSAELQAMISSLLLQIEDLRAQLNAQQVKGATTSSPTFVNFSAPSCKKLLNNLRSGDKGDNVSVLQDFLKQQGYIISSSEDSDNRFGSSTASAVSSFQQKYAGDILTPANLTRPNSFVGSRTRDKINALLCNGVVTPPVTPPTTTVPPVVVSTAPSVTLLSPNGGERLVAGQDLVIRWMSSNVPAGSKIVINIFNGSNATIHYPNNQIATLSSDATSYTWTVSPNLGNWGVGVNDFSRKLAMILGVKIANASTENIYIVRISLVDSNYNDLAYDDSNGTFTIAPTETTEPVATCPTISGPANGQIYTVGQDPVFTWPATRGKNTYAVDLTTDSNFSWWWNNGTGTGGGSSDLSAKFSSIKNDNYATYYAKGGGPVVPAIGTTYYWRVYAYDSATNQGCHSEVRTIKFVPASVTVVPEPSISSFTASAYTITPGSWVTLSWNTLNTSKLTMDYLGSIVGLSVPSGTKIVSPLQTTTYTINASNSQGKMAAKSVTVNVAQPTPTPVPAATVNLTASASPVVSGSPVTLSWTSTNASQITMDYQGTILTLAKPSGTKVVSPTVTTTYIVKAQNSAGVFAASSVTVNVTQPVVIVPVAACPTVTSPANGASYTVGQDITFSWPGAAGRNTYMVDLTTDPNFAWKWNNGSGAGGGSSSLSANLSSIRNSYYAGGRLAPAGVLEAGKTYYWRVYAYDSATMQGCHSEVRSIKIVGPTVSATVGAPGLYSPANGATILAGSNPTFSWSTGNYSTYIMDLTTDPNFGWQWNSGSGAIGGSSATSVTFSGIKNTTYSNGNPAPASLEAGKTYYWRVYGYNPASPSTGAHSAIYMFKVANMVATQTNQNTDQLANIYSSLQMIMDALKGLTR